MSHTIKSRDMSPQHYADAVTFARSARETSRVGSPRRRQLRAALRYCRSSLSYFYPGSVPPFVGALVR